MNIEMNKIQKILGSLLLGSILIYSFWGISTAAREAFESGEHKNHEHYKGDEDHDDDDDHDEQYKSVYSKAVLQQDAIYVDECGSCHMAFPATLLPTESWQKIMLGLAEHFDENAELDNETGIYLSNYLQHNALKRNEISRFSRMLRNIGDMAPLRISELPYFISEHNEIPKKMVVDNVEVGSFSKCESCHKDATEGVFDEHQINIPGFGRWDD